MSQNDRRERRERRERARHHLVVVQQKIDKAMDHADIGSQTGEEVACRRGCAWCCSQLVTVSMSEALLLYEVAAGDPLLLAKVRRWAADFAPLVERGELPEKKWFAQNIECAFLTAEKTCAAYAERPIACRVFVAIGTSDGCRPNASEPAQRVKTDHLVGRAALSLATTAAESGLPVGPVPLVVALKWTIVLVDKGPAALRRELERDKVPAYNLIDHTKFWYDRCLES